MGRALLLQPPRMGTKEVFYFYNRRGRKITVENKSEAEKLIRQGFLQTTPDSPFYNPVYDKGDEVIAQPINKEAEVKTAKGKRNYLEVIKI